MDEALKINLITELGMDKMPEKDREAALLKIGEIVFKGVLIRVLDTLDEAGTKEMNEFLSDPAKEHDPEALYAFLKNKVPNLDELADEEIADFKRTALETMNGMK